jgi:hypothetical protein
MMFIFHLDPDNTEYSSDKTEFLQFVSMGLIILAVFLEMILFMYTYMSDDQENRQKVYEVANPNKTTNIIVEEKPLEKKNTNSLFQKKSNSYKNLKSYKHVEDE